MERALELLVVFNYAIWNLIQLLVIENNILPVFQKPVSSLSKSLRKGIAMRSTPNLTIKTLVYVGVE